MSHPVPTRTYEEDELQYTNALLKKALRSNHELVKAAKMALRALEGSDDVVENALQAAIFRAESK